MKPHNKAITFIVMALMLTGLLLPMSVSASDSEQRVQFAQPILVVNTSFLNVRTGPGVEYSVLVTVVGGTELPVLGVANDDVWYQVATDGGPGWVNVNFTLARGNFTNVPAVDFDESAVLGQGGGATIGGSTSVAVGQQVTGVTLAGGDLRVQPGYDSIIIRSAIPNDPFTVYPLLGQTRDSAGVMWYLVNIPTIGTGWVDKINFAPLACGNEVVGIVQGPTPITFEGISTRDSYLLAANTQGYIVGRNPANSAQIRFQLVDGTVGHVAESDVSARSGFTNVCDSVPASLGQGGGAVPGGSVAAPVVPSFAANHVVVNTGNLNIRSGPGAEFSVVATVPGGTELEVLGRASDDVWFLVKGAFGEGWLNNQFAIFRGTYSTVPVIRDARSRALAGATLGQGGGAQPNQIASGQQVTGVTLIGGDLRAAPGYDALILRAAIPNDPTTVYPLLGQTTIDGINWYLVNIPTIGQGWVDKVNLTLLECGNDVVGRMVNSTPINFEGISNRDSFLLEPNTEGYIVGRRGPYLILQLVDGTVGNVPEEAVSPRPSDVISICEGVSAVAGVGTTPSASGSTTAQPAPSGNRVIVNTGNLNIRSGPSAVFSVVATVPGGTELSVVGRAPDGVWYLVRGAFGEGWLNSQFAIFRGNYSTVPVININS